LNNKNKFHLGVQYKERDTAYLIQPIDKSKSSRRALRDVIEEAEGLTRAIDLDVLKTQSANCSRIQSGSYFSKGIREQIAQDITQLDVATLFRTENV